MLLRIMRHPVGLMRMAWSRSFLLDTFRSPALPSSPPPDWWPGRYSTEGLLLAPPAAAAPPAPETAATPFPGSCPLPRHGGKAASLLGARA